MNNPFRLLLPLFFATGTALGGVHDRKPSGETRGEFATLLHDHFTRLEAGELSTEFDGAELLSAEMPELSEAQLERVRRQEEAATAAVSDAAHEAFGGAAVEIRSRGSSSRGTHAETEPDFDVTVKLPTTWTIAEFDAFFDGREEKFREALEQAARQRTAGLFAGEELEFRTARVQFTDSATRKPAHGARLLLLDAVDRKLDRRLKVDVLVTNLETYTNAYPEYFKDQLRQITERDGKPAAQKVLNDIRLAKAFFRDAVGAYHYYHGGPSAVGIEQMVMQSGRVLDGDRGQTVLETGSFDRMMERLYHSAFDERGQPRSAKTARRAWVVYNPFLEPGNFLSLVSGNAWRRLGTAVKNYREAKVIGRPIVFADLFRPRTPFTGTPDAGEHATATAHPSPSETAAAPTQARTEIPEDLRPES